MTFEATTASLQAGDPAHFGVAGRDVTEREDVLGTEHSEVPINLCESLGGARRIRAPAAEKALLPECVLHLYFLNAILHLLPASPL